MRVIHSRISRRLAALLIISALAPAPSAFAQAPAQTTGSGRLNLDNAVRTYAADAARVQGRKSDSLLNGALIGAGAGVGAGLLLCSLTEPWEVCRQDAAGMLKVGALGAGIGIAIDALIRRRTTDPTAPGASLHAAPVVSKRVVGAQVRLNF